MSFAYKSVLEIQEMIRNRETTSQEVWDYFMQRAETEDKNLGSFNSFNKGWFNNSEAELLGIPLGIKDIFCEKWIVTSGASKMLNDYVPPYESTITKKLKDAGMSSLGKCNMDEFAMGSSWENSQTKTTKNPHGTSRIPGWSSSGSAAAVAAWLVPAALGTDTGWSIRQPASMCWIVWFKPSYGRNSRFGIMPMASSLDTPGTFTHSVKDAAYLYNLMNGYDELEGSSLPGKDTIDISEFDKKDMSWVKVWVPKEYFEEGLDAWVKNKILETIKQMESLGAEIVNISLPMTKYAVAAYYIICPAEVTTNLARLDGIRYGHNSELSNNWVDEIYLHNRGEWLGDEPKRRSILWSYVLSAWFYDAYYKKAAQVRTLIIEDFKKAFEKVDVIVGPVAPSVAWELWKNSDDPLKMYLEDAYTIPASLAGLPWISIPCWFAESNDDKKESLPVWFQILGPRLWESKLLQIAHTLETSMNLRESMIPKAYKA